MPLCRVVKLQFSFHAEIWQKIPNDTIGTPLALWCQQQAIIKHQIS